MRAAILDHCSLLSVSIYAFLKKKWSGRSGNSYHAANVTVRLGNKERSEFIGCKEWRKKKGSVIDKLRI